MRHSVILLLLALLLIKCTSPLDKKYNKISFHNDLKKIAEKYPDIDTSLLSMMNQFPILYFDDTVIPNKSYRQVLIEGKRNYDKLKAEEEKQKEEREKQNAIKAKKLQESVLVKVLYKGFGEFEYQNYLTYKFEISNKSNKDIRAVKGTIKFNNLFGDNISSMNFVYDEKIILAGKKVIWNAQSVYNPYPNILTGDDVTLRNKDLKDIKVEWKAEKIIFTDSTTLETN